MSNHHSAVGSEKTKKYEIIRSHQAFTFGTVPLDHTVRGGSRPYYICTFEGFPQKKVCQIWWKTQKTVIWLNIFRLLTSPHQQL